MSMLAGMLLGLGASASWALANVAVQRAGRAVGALRALFWAQVLGIAMSGLGALAMSGRLPALTAADGGWLALAAVSGLAAYSCLFYAFEHGRLTIAVPIMSSWAVLSSGLSLLLFHDRLTAMQLVGSATVIAGAVVVGRHAQLENGGRVGATRSWLWASVGAAIGFGILIPTMRRLTPVFGPVATIGVVYAADLVLALPLALWFRVGLAPPEGISWLPVFLAGLLETAGSVSITLGMQRAPVAIVSPLASLASTLTVLYAWAILRERPAVGVLVGAALVSVGVVVLAI
jgi:drug/metabolite transporter (DMT)-like permease